MSGFSTYVAKARFMFQKGGQVSLAKGGRPLGRRTARGIHQEKSGSSTKKKGERGKNRGSITGSSFLEMNPVLPRGWSLIDVLGRLQGGLGPEGEDVYKPYKPSRKEGAPP